MVSEPGQSADNEDDGEAEGGGQGAQDSCEPDMLWAGRDLYSAGNIEIHHHYGAKLEQAGRDEVITYLTALVRWLDADSWPRDVRRGGSTLVPSEIERKLRVTGASHEEDQDADELSERCSRLVVLGGSGAGKTWLAKRAARRCAVAALDGLGAGASLDQVELPLFTTCARLTAMPSGVSIRNAVVDSALAQLPDLGGSSVTLAVQALFANRNAPTLLVLDSLDESAGPDDRIRLVGQMRPEWRIILTSRPSSWNWQFAIQNASDDLSQYVGTLQPLRYPDDIDSVIDRWFAMEPELGDSLKAQVREKAELREAATVPLILAFYCIIGGQEPLPTSSTAVHAKVINRMLTGRWRGSGQDHPDIVRCQQTLRCWAWDAAASDHVSGVGKWDDEFTVEFMPEPCDRVALDHVAIPQPPDPDDGKMRRRFAHRSILEHLVADYVASLPAEEAAEILAGHLWFDPDWQQYALHTAIVLHPRRDEVLRAIVRRVTGSSEFPGDILALDSHFQIRALLAHLAAGTAEVDWSPASAALIGRARTDLAETGWGACLVPANGWSASRDQLVQALLGTLEADRWGVSACGLVDALTKMDLSETESDRMRTAVLGTLTRASSIDVPDLAALLSRLAPTAAERVQARDHVMHQLLRDYDYSYFNFGRQHGEALASLTETNEERATLLAELIKSIGHRDRDFTGIAEVIGQLGPTARQRLSARGSLLRRLGTESWGGTAADLGMAIARLRPTRRERSAVLDSLVQCFIRANGPLPDEAGAVINELGLTREDRQRVHVALIEAIEREASWGNADKACRLTRLFSELGPAVHERRRVQGALIDAISAGIDHRSVHDLALAGLALQPDPADRERFRLHGLAAALALCDSRRTRRRAGLEFLRSLPKLATTADERAHALNAVLEYLMCKDRPLWSACEALTALADTPEAREHAQAALFANLAERTASHDIVIIAGFLRTLVHGQEDRDRLRVTLLGKLAEIAFPNDLGAVAELIGELSESESSKEELRKLLLKSLIEIGDGPMNWRLAKEIASLRPVVTDLNDFENPPYGLGDEVLAAMRANSPLDEWLRVLPEISQPRQMTEA